MAEETIDNDVKNDDDKAKIVRKAEDLPKDVLDEILKSQEKGTKFTDAQKDDYIEKLKDENAKRRIKASKLEEEKKRVEEQAIKFQKELDELKTKLSKVDEEKKKKEDAEKSEIEKVKTQMNDLLSKFDTTNSELQKAQKALFEKEFKIQQIDRENLVDKLVRKFDYQFASEYERNGFIHEMTSRNDDGFKLNDEEVVMKIKEFVKENKKVAKTPQAGPSNKITEMPVMDEVKSLLSKRDLNFEEKKRLDELLLQIG